MAAVRMPASGLAPMLTREMPSTTRMHPKTKAWEGSMMPAGRGRFLVRSILASLSRSHHMLMAPQPPAASAVPTAKEKITRPSTGVWGALQK